MIKLPTHKKKDPTLEQPPKGTLDQVLDMDDEVAEQSVGTVDAQSVTKRGFLRRFGKYIVLRPKKERLFFGLLKNDLEFVDTEVLSEKIHEQSHFSILYLALLVSSVVVCTLGLLIGSTAIVIGGMLIAPLMWPLARLGYGIALRSPIHLYRGAVLVAGSILIGTISAYLITSISPIKVINDEILARTAPTIMDLFIALAAGFVAAVAITQKKIADSLAGVAIAVSLMPPLCTVGIALSLRNIEYSLGALLLFAVNAACIVLVTTAALVYIEYERTGKIHIAKRAAALNLFVVLLMAVPLVQFLRSHTFALSSYDAVSSSMTTFIAQKGPSAAFENIEIVNDAQDTVQVSADMLLPSDALFTYEDNDTLVTEIENAIGKDVSLNLRIQNIIEPISKSERENEKTIDQLRSAFAMELASVSEGLRISTMNVAQRPDSGWSIDANVFTDPETVPTSSQVTDIGRRLSEQFEQQVSVNATFVPQLTLRSTEQTLTEEIRGVVDRVTKATVTDAEVSMLSVNQSSGITSLEYVVTSTDAGSFDDDYLQAVNSRLDPLIDGGLRLNVRVVSAVDISL